MPWVTTHSPRSEALEACVTCGLCLPVCPTFRITGDETASPRGRLAAMSVVDAGNAPVGERFAEMMSLCLQCRACETACPSLVPFGDAMEGARAEVEAQVPARGSRLRRFVLVTVLGSRFMLRVATIGAAVLERLHLLTRIPVLGKQAKSLRPIPLPVQSAAGGAWGVPGHPVAALLTGCVADVWFSPVHAATIRVLVAAGYRVEALKAQTCCGALASHSGFAEDAKEMALRNIAVFSAAQVIVTDVAGCGAHLKAYGRFGPEGAAIAAKVRDIDEVIAAVIADGRLPRTEPTGTQVAIQDPCHLEHGQKAHLAVDAVVLAAGYTPVPVDRGGLCCGAAGVYQLEHPEMSATLGRQKVDSLTDAGIKLIVSANAGCELQLRRYLDEGYEVKHPVELYADTLGRQTTTG
jgi:glycolate oxidase iron-sulfur subunit